MRFVVNILIFKLILAALESSFLVLDTQKPRFFKFDYFFQKTETPKIGKSIFNALKRKHDISPSTELSPAKSASKTNTPGSVERKKSSSRAPRIFNIKFSKCFGKKNPVSGNITADKVTLTPLGSSKENQGENSTGIVEINLNVAIKEQDENIPPEKLEKMRVRRRYKCEELLQTEKNYVEILNTINDVGFKL